MSKEELELFIMRCTYLWVFVVGTVFTLKMMGVL